MAVVDELNIPEEESPRRGRPERQRDVYYLSLDIGGLQDYVRERAREEHTSMTQYIRSLVKADQLARKKEAAPSQD